MDFRVLWLVLMLGFIVIEVLSVNMVTIWLALGSLSALIVACITDNIIIHLLVFLIVAVVALIATKPFVDKFKPKFTKTNLDSLEGTRGVVIKKPTKKEQGMAKVNGKQWIIKTDDVLEVDDIIEVIKFEGIKLYVRKVDEK